MNTKITNNVVLSLTTTKGDFFFAINGGGNTMFSLQNTAQLGTF